MKEILKSILNIPNLLGELAVRELQKLTPVDMDELNQHIAETAAEILDND